MRWCCSWSVWSTIHKYFNLGYHEVVFVVSTGRGERITYIQGENVVLFWCMYWNIEHDLQANSPGPFSRNF